MKKSKKMLSVFCALSLLLVALPAASAVPVTSAAETEPISEYAGKTITVQFVKETEHGLDSRLIDVMIPVGATRAEEETLIYSAMFEDGGISPYTANYEIPYLISHEDHPFRLTENPQKVGGGPVQFVTFDELSKILITFDITGYQYSSSQLGFQIRTTVDGVVDTSDWDYLEIKNKPDRIYFYKGTYPRPGADGIEVYAKVKNGSYVDISYCLVRGIVG